MEYRKLGKTGWHVSAISMGCWSISGVWGAVDKREFWAALHKAVELGINFFDTADVYGPSEEMLGKFRRQTRANFYIATKIGRRFNPHVPAAYTKENLAAAVEKCLQTLGAETLDLVQLHSPPYEVYYMPEVFESMDDLVKEGKVQHYGVSVEKVEQALKAVEYPNVKTVQIVFNIFRQRPAELFFRVARERDVGVIARLPLASGLLTGKFSRSTKFAANDHRYFNRHGEAWDKGETFAGVDFETGINAVEELQKICPPEMSMAQFALRWILMFEEVSCAIPGAKRAAQVEENAAAADFPPLPPSVMDQVRAIYEAWIKKQVHHRW